ncbi:MAG: class I SAM-dependent methyltransferase [Candidatus Helarchaeota archaeon]
MNIRGNITTEPFNQNSRALIDLLLLNKVEQFPWEIKRIKRLLTSLVKSGAIPKGKVLDLCSGTGSNGLHLSQYDLKVTGIDLLFEQAPYHIPFDNASFDFVMDVGCFPFLEIKNRTNYAAQIIRVLKSGGKFLLITPSFLNGASWNHFTSQQILDLFFPALKVKLLQHFPLDTNADLKYYYAFLMEKK